MLPSFGNLTKVLLEMSALAGIFIREPSCVTFYILFQVLEVYIMHDTFTVYIMTSYLHNFANRAFIQFPLNMGSHMICRSY